MQEIIFIDTAYGHVLRGFHGDVVKKTAQDGVHIPASLMAIFRPKTKAAPASRVYVERRDDPDQHFVANVSRAGTRQYIVHVPIKHRTRDPRFPPGTGCFVRMATAHDKAVS